MTLALILLSAAFSWLFCRVVRDRLIAAKVMDQPNARSLHEAPVPRGGGWAVWLAVLPLWAMVAFAQGELYQYIYLLAGMGVLIAVSGLDDRRSVNIALRLAAQLFAVLLGLTGLSPDLTIFHDWLPLWADRLITLVAWLWFINLTNFMDGVDGLSGVEGSSIAVGFLAILLANNVDHFPGLVPAACLLGALLGFLYWNWHKAKLFLGDVGSVPLGFVLGYLLILLAGRFGVGVALALPLYYLADATITLGRRILQRKKFWHGHREHFYQQAALAVGAHDRVVRPVIAVNAALVIVTFFAVLLGDEYLLAAPVLVGLLLWHFARLAKKPVQAA